MPCEPQAADYIPDPAISEISDWLADPVKAAVFPETRLRFRNRRWDKAVGLGDFSDEQFVRHFGCFEPLEQNLPEPLAMRYHGHQFRTYNPDIGDGRGFLFGQLRDGSGRLLDLGTKGSGTTPYSRTADGRLTLKGGVREILATEMLEALGVNTSKTLAIIETGEELERGDEPSPTRSAVMTRLSHGHIRIGSFQRLFVLQEENHLRELISYCVKQYPGSLPPAESAGGDEPAIILLHQVVERMADLAAAYMVAGFVHGVLNTDNMNISGESFDYGPWRWLPSWNPGFTAAYFDQTGLYSFARQPEAIHWNCGQLAIAFSQVAPRDGLAMALQRFGPLYQAAMGRRWIWRLGLISRGATNDATVLEASEQTMRESRIGPDEFFFRHRGGRDAAGALARAIAGYEAVSDTHDYWSGGAPQSMLIDEVETIWSAIADRDDWGPLNAKVEAVRAMGYAMGDSPALSTRE
ncbi:protein adenylyltransferase SelO family protein [Altererythrobacter aquiaggeris]|uniref:protein adenylyltransferase SelO family protein n=1 Tax=Aestuarierythrobacter aquiaggeris TaxID=1898396 RepID=UPI0030160323